MFIRSCTHCLTPMYYIVVYQYWPLTDAHYAFIHPLISFLISPYFRLIFPLIPPSCPGSEYSSRSVFSCIAGCVLAYSM